MKKITFKGEALHLAGRNLRIGSRTPDFKAVSKDMKEVSLGDFGDNVKIITSFPSLDTPVCDLQVKKFNKEVSKASDKVRIIGVSKDLPFALSRFCAANNIDKVETLSDYKFSSFGINYGLLVEELNLLARSVLVLDGNNVLRYRQIVEELTDQPDYQKVISAVKEVIGAPSLEEAGMPLSCEPCKKGTPPLNKEKVEELIARHKGWDVLKDSKLVKEFKFSDFKRAKYFLDIISFIAQEQNHHPTLLLGWGRVKVTLTTHAAGGLTSNDFVMAGIIDQIELGG